MQHKIFGLEYKRFCSSALKILFIGLLTVISCLAAFVKGACLLASNAYANRRAFYSFVYDSADVTQQIFYSEYNRYYLYGFSVVVMAISIFGFQASIPAVLLAGSLAILLPCWLFALFVMAFFRILLGSMGAGL